MIISRAARICPLDRVTPDLMVAFSVLPIPSTVIPEKSPLASARESPTCKVRVFLVSMFSKLAVFGLDLEIFVKRKRVDF